MQWKDQPWTKTVLLQLSCLSSGWCELFFFFSFSVWNICCTMLKVTTASVRVCVCLYVCVCVCVCVSVFVAAPAHFQSEPGGHHCVVTVGCPHVLSSLQPHHPNPTWHMRCPALMDICDSVCVCVCVCVWVLYGCIQTILWIIQI